MEPGEAGLRRRHPLRGAAATLPAARITQIRLYQGPNVMPLQIPLLQSSMVVAIDTDIGITGIGEGGTLDTIAPCAARLIGRNPFEITRIWRDMIVRTTIRQAASGCTPWERWTWPSGISRGRP